MSIGCTINIGPQVLALARWHATAHDHLTKMRGWQDNSIHKSFDCYRDTPILTSSILAGSGTDKRIQNMP
jgi:hypothetical protein